LETLDIPWSTTITIKNQLLAKFEKYGSPKEIDCIVAIKRGGVWLGKHFSERFNIPIEYIHISFRHNKFIIPKKYKDLTNKNILVVDDIYDSGKTIDYIKNNIECKSLSAAFLLTKNIRILPYMWGATARPDLWVNFPWENKLESPKKLLDFVRYNYLVK